MTGKSPRPTRASLSPRLARATRAARLERASLALRRARLLAAVASATLVLTSCGTSQGIDSAGGSSRDTSRSGDAQQDQDATGDRDVVVKPPREYYDALFADAAHGFALATQDSVLFVNFDGATVAKGFALGQSFIPCQASSSIPAAGLSPADRDQVLAAVQKFYDDTGAKVTVTDLAPASGDYTTMHVGGTYGDLGCSGGNGVLGVAPFDVGNANRNDVGFAFNPPGLSLRTLAETIAHEAGHSYGLEHVVTTSDLMYASATQNITGFGVSRVASGTKTQDAPAMLRAALGPGANAPAPAPAPAPGGQTPQLPGLGNLPAILASLPGLGQLASIGQLLPGLNPGALVDLSQLLPQLTAIIPLNGGAAGLPGLDKILTIIGIASQAGAAQQGGGVPAGLPIAIDPKLAALILSPQNLQQLGGLGNLLQLGGFGNATNAVDALQQIFSKGAGASLPAVVSGQVPQIAGVPDLSQLLGLGATPDLATLLQNLGGTTSVINGNFGGADKDALLSLVKLAYAQEYLQLLQGLQGSAQP